MPNENLSEPAGGRAHPRPRRRASRVRRAATVTDRLRLYLEECRRRGAAYVRFRIDDFARRLSVSRRSILYARRRLAVEGVSFAVRRQGRSDCLYVVFDMRKWAEITARKPPPRRRVQGAKSGGIGGKGDFPSENKEINKHRLAAAAAKKRLERKAWHVARGLLPQHWDNCKVRASLRHAYGYALRSLRAGYDAGAITGAYRRALHRRHQDATDAGLCRGQPTTRWEASSTVSLASSVLRGGCRPRRDHHAARAAYRRWIEGLGDTEYCRWREYAVATVGESAYFAEDEVVVACWLEWTNGTAGTDGSCPHTPPRGGDIL